MERSATNLLLILLTTFWPAVSLSQMPLPYSAEYEAKSSGLSATGYRSLQSIGDGSYMLENSVELKVIGARIAGVNETSVFDWQGDHLIARSYNLEQTGLGSKSEHIDFDHTRALAISTEDDETWEIAITPDIVDKLSYQYWIRHVLQAGDAREVEIQLVDTDEIETHLYRVVSEEIIDTPAGNFNALKIERVREGNSGRVTQIWLALDWDLLVVKLEQISRSGSKTELTLKNATLDGKPVTPLP